MRFMKTQQPIMWDFCCFISLKKINYFINICSFLNKNKMYLTVYSKKIIMAKVIFNSEIIILNIN